MVYIQAGGHMATEQRYELLTKNLPMYAAISHARKSELSKYLVLEKCLKCLKYFHISEISSPKISQISENISNI